MTPALLLLILGCAPRVEWIIVDADGDGFESWEDCDDNNPSAAPGFGEICDGVDNDCDGLVDEQVTQLHPLFFDQDGDGYGGPEAVMGCEGDPYTALANDDCDDTDASISPEGLEICDEVDNDCDGLVDQADDSVEAAPSWPDQDGDFFGNSNATPAHLCTPPDGYSVVGEDCDDRDPDTWPGATEICDGVDNDCDGALGEDEVDGDYDGFLLCDGDPDDTDPESIPYLEARVGGRDRAWEDEGIFRGNAYLADADSTLIRFWAYLDAPMGCPVTSYVFSSEDLENWEIAWMEDRTAEEDGEQYVYSGEVWLDTSAGVTYILGFGWSCSATYFSGSYGSGQGDDGAIGRFEGSAWSNEYVGADQEIEGFDDGTGAVYDQMVAVVP